MLDRRNSEIWHGKLRFPTVCLFVHSGSLVAEVVSSLATDEFECMPQGMRCNEMSPQVRFPFLCSRFFLHPSDDRRNLQPIQEFMSASNRFVLVKSCPLSLLNYLHASIRIKLNCIFIQWNWLTRFTTSPSIFARTRISSRADQHISYSNRGEFEFTPANTRRHFSIHARALISILSQLFVISPGGVCNQ